MRIDGYDVEELSGRVIQCIINVHRTLGPGFLEKVYRRALRIELCKHELTPETGKRVVIHYDGEEVGRHRLDLVVHASLRISCEDIPKCREMTAHASYHKNG